MATWFIAPDRLLGLLGLDAVPETRAIALEGLSDALWEEVEACLAAGGSAIVVGSAALPRLRSLWIDGQACAATDLRDAGASLLPVPATGWRSTVCRSLAIRPGKTHAYFGIDEMPRADIVPLVEARDAAGQACAYAAVWMKHYAPSLTGGRFGGANLYVYAFEDPLAAATPEQWLSLVQSLARHASAGLGLTRVRCHYALYRPGEQALVRVGLSNRTPGIAAVRLELGAVGPDGAPGAARSLSRHLNPGEQVEADWEFPCGSQAGLWRVTAELWHEDRFLYGPKRQPAGELVERGTCAFVVPSPDPAAQARPRLDGRTFAIGTDDGFLAGTHYYPASSWWDWAWRDVRPDLMQADLAEMVRHGYRFARVWIDPELDEAALRGFEAWLHLSGACGLVSIVCVFTQWARTLTYPDGTEMVRFDFAGPADYNVYSVLLTHIEPQRRYLGVLARRWAELPNLIWNLANEAYIVDPSPEQVDMRFFADVEPRQGPLAGAAYFNRWADLMTEALRAHGARQPVLRGYGFINGGDCYLQNRTGAMLLWHHYVSAETAGPCLAFAAPGTLAKPLLLEEFGIPTLDEEERLERYEGIACWAAAMGAAGACAYEWGVRWLAPELPFTVTPLKDCSLAAEPDPRWMDGQVQYSASWPLGSMGLCPWAASFSYGSNVPCTPFAAPAAAALGAVARFCRGIGPPRGQESVLLVVPMEWSGFAPLQGYARVLQPTIAAIQALAAAHVPFTVVQEDQLEAVTGQPACVVFPAVGEVAPATRAQLHRLAASGATLHASLTEGLSAELAAHALPLECDGPVWCVRRRTRAGRLYLLFAPDGPARVRLRDGSAVAELDVRRYALAEVLDQGTCRTWVGRAAGPHRR